MIKKLAFFLTNLIGYSYCDSICVYYTNYPSDQTFQTVTCTYGCCGSSYPSKASDACCPAPNNTWLAYPIVFISLLVIGSIIYAFCCSKLKPSIHSRFKKINPTSTRMETEIQISQEMPSVYSINSNYSQEHSSINTNGEENWMQTRISSAPPPRYDEVFQTHSNPVIHLNSNSTDMLPVLPGSYIPVNEQTKNNF